MFYLIARQTCILNHHWIWDWLLAITVMLISAQKHKQRGNMMMVKRHTKRAIILTLKPWEWMKGGEE